MTYFVKQGSGVANRKLVTRRENRRFERAGSSQLCVAIQTTIPKDSQF